MTDSDDEIALSADTLAALAEFHAERDSAQAKFKELQAEAEVENGPLSMEAFGEDWNESQFWYSNETASALAHQLLDGARSRTSIGVISTPSAFVALKNILRTRPESERPRLVLLEHDHRFRVFEEFVYYDFQKPLELPVAMTVRWLFKTRIPELPAPQVILNTGERLNQLIAKVYRPFGLRPTTFMLKHARGLSNEFYCYANFECPTWTWLPETA
ncbi:hypothetical protein RJ55_00052 [Drechmeria coniospora]|nr:hypothetical protein RJ55_00052 [Drechmeria coniospora]